MMKQCRLLYKQQLSLVERYQMWQSNQGESDGTLLCEHIHLVKKPKIICLLW